MPAGLTAALAPSLICTHAQGSDIMHKETYLQRHGDVVMAGMNADEHYEWLGRRLGRKRDLDHASIVRDEGCHVALWEDRGDPNCSTYRHRPYRSLHPLAAQAAVAHYLQSRAMSSAEIAVVSAITGSYDTPKLYEHFMSNVDYFLFTDLYKNHPVFSTRPFPFFHYESTRMARFVKTHLPVFFGSYRTIVWVDGNILIRGDLTEEIDLFMQSGQPIAAVPHPVRNSVFDEGQACSSLGKDNPSVIEQQMRRYQDAGFRSDWLIESNLLMFRPDHPQLNNILNTWWGEIETGSRRDQLSLPYAIERHKADWFRLAEAPSSVRNHPKLVLVDHENNPALVSSIATMPLAEQTYSRFLDRKSERLAAQADRSVDIVVCVHNALDCVRRCLQSVETFRDAHRHRLVVVNDGSDAQTSAWLRSFIADKANCHLIEHETARGYTKAANAGMKAATGEFIVLLNSDTEVAANWVEKLLDTFAAFPGIGVVGPMSNAASHQSLPDHRSSSDQTAINALPAGMDVAAMDRWCEQQARAQAHTLVPLVHGFCIAFRKSVLDAVGHFDESAFPHGYGEENDLCLRVASAGYLLAVALHTFVYHEKSMSFDSERRVTLMKAGAAMLREKHSSHRVSNCVRSMQANPEFVRLRHLSSRLLIDQATS